MPISSPQHSQKTCIDAMFSRNRTERHKFPSARASTRYLISDTLAEPDLAHLDCIDHPEPGPTSVEPELDCNLSSVTVVSAYWHVGTNSRRLKNYNKWMSNALRINAPMVFFYEDDAVQTYIASIRNDLPTHFVRLHSANFTVKPLYNSSWIHGELSPNPAVNLIKLERAFILERASQMNVFNSCWVAWMDATVSPYRMKRPGSRAWPALESLRTLPRDKTMYTIIPEQKFEFSTLAFMCAVEHAESLRKMMETVISLCTVQVSDWRCGFDQSIFTWARDNYPHAFHQLGEGRGELMHLLM